MRMLALKSIPGASHVAVWVHASLLLKTVRLSAAIEEFVVVEGHTNDSLGPRASPRPESLQQIRVQREVPRALGVVRRRFVEAPDLLLDR